MGTLGARDGEANGAVVDAQDSPVQGRGRSAACWPVRARRCSRTRFRRLRPGADSFVDAVEAIDAQGYTALAMGRSAVGLVEALKRYIAQVACQSEQSNSAPLQLTGIATYSTSKPGRSKHTFAPLQTTGVAAYSTLKHRTAQVPG